MFTYFQLLELLHLISFVLCAPPVCQFAPKFQFRVMAFLKTFLLKSIQRNSVRTKWKYELSFPSNHIEYVSLKSQGLNPQYIEKFRIFFCDKSMIFFWIFFSQKTNLIKLPNSIHGSSRQPQKKKNAQKYSFSYF
jgi:hypothetical protein